MSHPMIIVINFGRAAKFNRPVMTFKEAAQVMRDVVSAGDYGASDMCGACGDVVDATGRKVGNISYNGRAWAVTGEEIKV